MLICMSNRHLETYNYQYQTLFPPPLGSPRSVNNTAICSHCSPKLASPFSCPKHLPGCWPQVLQGTWSLGHSQPFIPTAVDETELPEKVGELRALHSTVGLLFDLRWNVPFYNKSQKKGEGKEQIDVLLYHWKDNKVFDSFFQWSVALGKHDFGLG